MRTLKALPLVVLGFTLAPAVAVADVASDRAAAIVVFPTVEALRAVDAGDTSTVAFTIDTVIQLSNTSNQPVRAHCFYVNAVGQCSISGAGCFETFECPATQDLCLPQWVETDFDINLTPRQPLAWRATRGLTRDLLPLDGVNFVGPDGSSNAGTLVPPIQLEPFFDDEADLAEFFLGELKCIAVDASGRAVPRNVLKGEATVTDQTEQIVPAPGVSIRRPIVTKYNAIGIQAIEGDANDGILELGGGSNEYNGCSQVLIAQHNFDFAIVNDLYAPLSVLYLVPCTQDFRTQTPGATTVQFLVFNEFEQRFSTSRPIDCLFISFLSGIDTNQEENSIWSVGVAGTVAGQTRIRGVQTGLIGIINELGIAGLPGEAMNHLGLQGDREQTDRITLPR